MQLTPGSRLGPYEILSPLGAGGMGEVFRARDTRLGREVAVKVLPQHLTAHAEVRARFEREAKTVSSLNHPHICTLFDVGREGDTDYLVMELIEGETLAARLVKGVMPALDVLKLGGQIADALDRAHRAGVVHRDLKPGNVMLTKSGAKLMDFGLARAAGLGGPPGSGLSGAALTQSPTIAQPLTAEGTIVGTFQYMSPEQLEGKEADARSDLWALGCVLYEMSTGRRAFDGTTQASLISAIMRDTPRPLAEFAPMSPPALERLVVALLAKDPEERIQTAHDAKLQLGWLLDAGVSTPSSAGAASVPAGGRPRRVSPAWVIAGLAAVVAIAAWLPTFTGGRGAGRDRARLLVPEPAGTHLDNVASSFAISPDGKTIVFVASDSSATARLWLRPLETLTPKPIEGTEHAEQPFWSPDSRWIGFFADGKLRKVGVAGGRVETICDAPDPRGGTWGDGTILFAPFTAGPLYTVPADGGTPAVVLRPDSARGETALRFPQFLSDRRGFVFVSLPRRDGVYEVYWGRLGSGERRHVMSAGAVPVHAEPGFLVTLEKERLVAWRFDAGKGEITGKAVTIGDAPLALGHDGVRAVSASRNGVLAYWGGTWSNTQLAWLDRTGRIERTFSLPAGQWGDATLSRDGTRAVVTRRNTSAEADLWMVDLESGQASRFTFKPVAGLGGAVWSPDGRRIVYSDMSNGPAELILRSVAGGEPELLYGGGALFKNPYDWSPDGKYVLFEQPDRDTGWDLWLIEVDGDRTPLPLVRTPSNEGAGCFSPDGRWFAYGSYETGSNEICVQSFPEPGVRHVLSGMRTSDAAPDLSWSRDGREIMCATNDGLFRVIDVEAGEKFRAGRARVLFRASEDVIGARPLPDHRRLLATVRVGEAQAQAIVVDVNWTAALEDQP